MPHIQFVFVEGNIGAGKSTYLDRVLPLLTLPADQRIIGVPEPLAAWTGIPDVHDKTLTHNLFASFYNDRPRYAALFQAHAMQTRITAVVQAVDRALAAPQNANCAKLWVVCERSIYTDAHIFVRALVEGGDMSALEHAVYMAWWDFWKNNDPYHAAHARAAIAPVIYLATPSTECQQRMRQRDRTEENGVPLAYLDRLTKFHDEALAYGTRGWLNSPCLCVMPGEAGNFATNDIDAAKCATKLADFLRSL